MKNIVFESIGYVGIICVILVAFTGASTSLQSFAQTSAIQHMTITTAQFSCSYGDTIVIKGIVTNPTDNTQVTVKVFNSLQNLSVIDQVPLSPDGNFSFRSMATGPLWQQAGNVKIVAQYGRYVNATATISCASQTPDNTTVTNIPSWIKNNAKWWSQGQVGDSEFIQGIQYLIEQGIMKIPQTSTFSNSANGIPTWVKNNAKWWSEGSLDDSEFVKGIQYLVQSGIIHINPPKLATSQTNQQTSTQVQQMNSVFPPSGTTAIISTNFGEIKFLLLDNVAPKTVNNFEKLSDSGFYDGTVFYRIIPGFVIQGGDPNTKNGTRDTWGTGDAGYTIHPEFSSNLKFTKYMVGMARGSDFNSGSSQFFITLGDDSSLNNEYTLFGKVISGQDVVDKIASIKTDPSTNQPIDPNEARIIKIMIQI